MSLAVIGEDCQEKDGIGVEMQGLQLIVAEEKEEELGEGRHQASSNGTYEERIEGAPLTLRDGGLALNTFAPLMPRAVAIRRNRARLASDTFGESRADEYQATAGD